MHKKYVRFKRDWNSRSERLETRPRGEPTEKRSGKAEIQNEILPLSRKYIPETNKAPPFFCGENQMLEGTVGVQRETAAKFREKGKSGGQFGLRWGRKSGTKSFEGGVNRFGRLEKFLPLRCRKFLPASLQKAQKGNGCTFVLRLVLRHCRWLLRIFSKVRSAVPKNPSEQKSGGPGSSNGRATRALRIPQGQK